MSSKFTGQPCPIFRTIDDEWLLTGAKDLHDTTLIDIDLSTLSLDWSSISVDSTTLFVGCQLGLEDELQLRRRGAGFLNAPKGLPYRPTRRQLYTWQELMEGYTPELDRSVDLKIYKHYESSKSCPSINEALWQRLHDFSVDEGLRRLLSFSPDGLPKRKVVGVMGGHGTSRTSPDYVNTVRTTKLLTEQGYFIVSGGGPGIMEAANMGAYLAGRTEADFDWVLETVGKAPTYKDPGFNDAALAVLERFTEGAESLAIPTWFYGHEPSNLFATYIAKYFSNSIREDTLLAIALYGIVYAPGSAGTTQEIFMDATQNHYGTFGYVSPMVFLGKHRYTVETNLYSLVEQLAEGMEYADYLYLTDEPQGVLDFIASHPPAKFS